MTNTKENGTRGAGAGLTRRDIESNLYIYGLVREQAASMRRDIARHGKVSWTGAGYHRTLARPRAFALRVLVAKGELKRGCRSTMIWQAA